MLKAFKTYYLKNRVISIGYKLPKVLTELVRSPLENPEDHFMENEPLCYWEACFVSHIVKKWKIDEASMSRFELERYKEGVKQLAEFRNLVDFLNGLNLFHMEVETLWLDVQREYATANMWARREKTTNTYEHDVEQAVQNYVKLIKDTEKWPDWNEKIKDEVGYFVHLVYNSLVSDPNFAAIFEKFDKQYFFK